MADRTSRRDAVRPGPAGRLIAAVYDLAMSGSERQIYTSHRHRLLAAAWGSVLDVGAGTGANLPYYRSDAVSDVVLLDPSAGMLDRAGRKTGQVAAVQLMRRRADEMPFAEESFDTVVFTLSLCTIPDPLAALREARRVLRPGGALLVLEHVRAGEPDLAAWQDRVTPIWRRVNGGCRLNRDTRASIESAGFAFETVRAFRESRIPLAILQPHLIGTARAQRR
ncbi:MAG: methyltransferase domain-containing protein [Candidatus Dormibacteraeota bacterium]|nr:methyltransferase domain-containing protein [Candidatus Dormibacteraeota bacterium]